MTGPNCCSWRIRSAAGCALVLSLAAFVGCEDNSATMTGQPPPSAGEHSALKGIPVPQGFRLDPKNSNTWEAGQVRFANCQFEGPGSIERVAEFYTQYMPAAKFTLKRRQLVAGEWNLEFASDSEIATVRVKPKGDRAVVGIELGPLPRGSAERESKPAAKTQPPREP